MLLLLLATALPAVAAQRPSTEAVAALNAARTARGLPRLSERPELSKGAQIHADDMAKRRYLAPSPPGDPTFRDRFRRAGYLPGSARIIVTAGYPDGRLLVEALIGEDPTADTLLDREAGEIGVGHVRGPFRVGGDVITHAWVLIVAKTAFPAVPGATDGLLAAINRARRDRGLAAVTIAPELSAAATDHAGEMVARGFVGHRSPDGAQVGDRAGRRGYAFRAIGENIASGQETPEAVVQGWTDSPGHARVMFDPGFREIGIGYHPGPVIEARRSFGHVWVAVFGRRD